MHQLTYKSDKFTIYPDLPQQKQSDWPVKETDTKLVQ